MNYRLTIFPALEAAQASKEFFFETEEELKAARDTSAVLLLYLQDDLKVMSDFSNVFYGDVLIDGDWEELESE